MKNRRKRKMSGGWKSLLPQLSMIIPVLVILAAGYESVTLVKGFLPDYRGEIVTYDKVLRDSLIKAEENEERGLEWPWDRYDAERAVRIPELYPDIDEQNEWQTKVYYQNKFDLWTQMLAPWCIPGGYQPYDLNVLGKIRGEDIYSYLTIQDKDYYLKDYPIDASGVRYLADQMTSVWNGRGIAYHYRASARPEIPESEIRETESELLAWVSKLSLSIGNRMVEYSSALGLDAVPKGGWSAEELSGLPAYLEDAYPDNPVIFAWVRLCNACRQAGPESGGLCLFYLNRAMELIALTAENGDPDCTCEAGEFRLSFRGEDGEEQMILYYDPEVRQICGITLRREE